VWHFTDRLDMHSNNFQRTWIAEHLFTRIYSENGIVFVMPTPRAPYMKSFSENKANHVHGMKKQVLAMT